MAWTLSNWEYYKPVPLDELDQFAQVTGIYSALLGGEETRHKCRNCGAPPTTNVTLCDYCGFRP